MTDVSGQADVAFRFPFSDGITEILFNARDYELVGYVRNGIETVMTKQVVVSGPAAVRPARPIQAAARGYQGADQRRTLCPSVGNS